MSAGQVRDGRGASVVLLFGGLIGLGCIALAVLSWQQVNEYATTAHAAGVPAPPLAEFTLTLAKPVAPLFEGGSGKGSPAAFAKAIQVVLGSIVALGAGVVLASIVGSNAAKSDE
jgi:hypothetical protein